MNLVWGEYYKHDSGRTIRYIPFHEGQQKIWDSKKRFLGYISGKGAGKSSFAPIWLDNEIRKNPKGNFIICAPTFAIVRQGILPEFFKTFDTELNDLYGGPDAWNATEKIYTLRTGGKIFVKSLDDEESVNGIHAHAIVVDECGLIPKSAWDILESRVALKKGRILATTTPYRRYKWLQHDFIARSNANDPDYFALQMPSTINPNFTEEELERIKAKIPFWKFAQDYLGRFDVPCEGLVYPELQSCVEPKPEGLTGQYVGGIDFGFNQRNPFAALAGILTDEGVLWLMYERYVREKTIEQHAAELPPNVTWYCDSSRPDCIRSLRHAGHLAKATKKHAGSVAANIDMVTNRIREGKLKIVEGTMPCLLAESDLYQYPNKDEDTLGNNPIDKDNHACDALAYLCNGISRFGTWA